MASFVPRTMSYIILFMLLTVGTCHIDKHAEKLRTCGTILLDLPKDLAHSFCSSYVGATDASATKKPSNSATPEYSHPIGTT